MVCPGVAFGDGCMIVAGSVVTRDIPADSFAAEATCRVIWEISKADSMANMPEVPADNQVLEDMG